MSKENLISKKILTYDDVVAYLAGASQEELVPINAFADNIIGEYKKHDMLRITGDTIYARKTLAEQLAKASAKLSKAEYQLKVVYGYRHPEIQEMYFEKRKRALAEKYQSLDEGELNRLTHNFVAMPDIAGHPAGAAIDVTLVDADGCEVDMGCEIADYTDEAKVKTFYPGITAAQLSNRLTLHDALVAEGFAPFYGEWWHFSYGDREWAAFYDKESLYGPIDFRPLDEDVPTQG